MARGAAPGERRGGRKKDVPNKRTVQKIIEASQDVEAIKRRGQKKATEILNDLMHTAMGFVALYQRKVMTEAGLLPEAKAEDITVLKEFMNAAGAFAAALAPYQQPKFKVVTFVPIDMNPGGAAPELKPGDNAKVVKGKVVDPNDVVRTYQQMVRRVG